MAEIVFRKGQDKVMEYNGGYMAVPSVPGAGKTFVLTQLAAKLIEEGMQRPGKILIVTYMNSAVANFKQRLYKLLKDRDLNPMEGYEVMTLHTLAMKIIREKPDKLLVSDEFVILDDTKRTELFREIFSKWISRNRKQLHDLIDTKRYYHQQLVRMGDKWEKDFYRIALGSFSYFKVQGYDCEMLTDKIGSRPGMIPLKWLIELYREYESALRIRGLIDFDDILVGALELLREDGELLERYQDRYTFIFEDEAQDSNIIQQEILTMLSEKSGNLLRVGDSNQAIMSTFTVSDPKLFREFCRNPFTDVQSINVASRSCNHIIDISNFFVDWVRSFHPCIDCRESLEPQYIEEVDGDDPHPNPVIDECSVYFKEFKTKHEELQFIADRCKGHMESQPDKTIAVLVPTNWVANELIDELEKRHVPFKEITRFPRERAYAANVIGAVLDFIVFPYKNRCLIEVVEYMLQDEEKENLEKLCDYLAKVPIEELLYPLYGRIDRDDIPDELIETGIWDRFEGIIPLLKEFLEMSSEMPEYLVLHIAERLNFDWDKMAIAQKIASDIRYLVSLNPSWSLMDLAQELKNIENSYNYFANIVYDMRGFEPEPGEVTVSTYHKAKGLEWDTVFLMAMTSYNFPATLDDKFRGDCYYLREEYQNPDALAKAQFDEFVGIREGGDYIEQSKKGIISERVRLLYVGMTRAKEYLILSTHNTPSIYFNVCKQYLLRAKRGVEVGW